MDRCAECSGELILTLSESVCTECGLVVPDMVTVEKLPLVSQNLIASAPTRDAPGTLAPSLFCSMFPDCVEEVVEPPKEPQVLCMRETSIRATRSFGDVVMDTLRLTDGVQEDARNMFVSLTSRGVVKADRRKVIFVACIFIAAREAGAARTLKELKRASGLRIRSIAKEVGVAGNKLNLQASCASPADSIVARLAPELGLDVPTTRNVVARARRLLSQCKDDVQGKSSNTVATLFLWKAVQEIGLNMTMRSVAVKTGTNPCTLKRLLQ
jgi:transcription initiation factor TFIIIB Brf1 subunit/transcription initiation factor TFIIB